MIRCLRVTFIPPTRTLDEGSAMSAATARTYRVEGMTCDHCRASVTEAVEQVPGVAGINVDLRASRLTLSGEDFSDVAIRHAVDQAGYRVVST